MDKFYTASTVMIVCSMMIMLVSIRYNIGLGKKRKRALALLFAVIIIGTVCEWSGNFMNGKAASLIPLHILVKMIELSIAPFVGLLCGRSFSDSSWERTVCCLLCFNMVLEVMSSVTGWIFYVDGSNFYHHGPLYGVYLAAYIVGCIYFVTQGIRISRNFQGNYGLAIMLVVIFVLSCILTQLMDSSIRIDWLAIALGTIMLYKFYGDMLLQMDGLTGLLNHWSYEHQIQNLSRKTTILFFDVDHFKYVNDTYGHAVGDQCLKNVAECLKGAYGRDGLCFRYGGDEFCVFSVKTPEEIERAAKEFQSLLARKRQLDERMPAVSCGYAEYDPKKDEIEAVMNRADEKMYASKREKC